MWMPLLMKVGIILGDSLDFMVLLKHQIVIFHGTSFVVLIPNLIFLGYVQGILIKR